MKEAPFPFRETGRFLYGFALMGNRSDTAQHRQHDDQPSGGMTAITGSGQQIEIQRYLDVSEFLGLIDVELIVQRVNRPGTCLGI